MIGLDTNVLVRYIAQDDPKQSGEATELIQALSAESPGFISLVSLVELVWVMQGCYKASKSEMAAILDMLLRTKELVVENTEAALKANNIYANTNTDFSDCLIAQCGALAGCEVTFTFDKNATKAAGMRLVGA